MKSSPSEREVESLSAGDRVAIEAVSGCGLCVHCQRGHYNVCRDWHHIGLTKHGVLAEFATLPSSALIPLPDEVGDDAAAFLEPLATAVHTLERIRPQPGQTAAIIGPGPLGLLHLQLLQAAGVGPVLVLGRAGDEARLDVARSIGADTAIAADGAEAVDLAMKLSHGSGLGLVIETAGTATAIRTALDIVAAEGTIATLGIVGKVEIDGLSVMRKEPDMDRRRLLGEAAFRGRHPHPSEWSDAPGTADHPSLPARRCGRWVGRAKAPRGGEGDVQPERLTTYEINTVRNSTGEAEERRTSGGLTRRFGRFLVSSKRFQALL